MTTKLKTLALGMTIGFVAIFLVGMMVTRNLAVEGTYTYLKLFNEVLSLVRSSYVDEVKTDSLMKGAYEGMLGELDPYSEYLTAEEYAALTKKPASARGAEAGRAAADAGIRVAKREGMAVVVAVRPGSDAEAKGIASGDHLRHVGDQSTREMPLFEIEAALAGPAGSTVAVSLIRREEPHKLDTDLTRREPAPDPPTLEIADAAAGIAVLRIPHFGPGVAAETAAALDRAEKQHARRLLIDLRGNAWGGMDEAARTAGLFVGDTVVARLKSKEGVADALRGSKTKGAYTGLVAVLINGGTAEAAEMFAAALHDARQATLLGETSFGVGAVQELIPLKNGAWLKLSVKKYVSPSGTSWHGTGLKPDRTVSVAQDNLKAADRLRQQLKLAVEITKGLTPGAAAATTALAGGGTGEAGSR